MDPFSVIAGAAGISQAGASLSRAIFNLISSTRSAPKEISLIARGISDLSRILREVRKVLRDAHAICKPSLLIAVSSTTGRIKKIHEEVRSLLDASRGLARLKWAFRKSKSAVLLNQIETHTTAINMILHTMTLALQLDIITKMNHATTALANADSKSNEGVAASSTSYPRRAEPDKPDDISVSKTASSGIKKGGQQPPMEYDREDAVLARNNAENLVHETFHTIRDYLLHGNAKPSFADGDSQSSEPSDDEGENKQIQLWDPQGRNSATWLHDLVFSPVRSLGTLEREGSSSIELEPQAHKDSQALQLLVQNPYDPSSVVNNLLLEWTTLTQDEVEVISIPDSRASKKDDPRSSSPEGRANQSPFVAVEKPSINAKYNHKIRECRVGKGILRGPADASDRMDAREMRFDNRAASSSSTVRSKRVYPSSNNKEKDDSSIGTDPSSASDNDLQALALGGALGSFLAKRWLSSRKKKLKLARKERERSGNLSQSRASHRTRVLSDYDSYYDDSSDFSSSGDGLPPRYDRKDKDSKHCGSLRASTQAERGGEQRPREV